MTRNPFPSDLTDEQWDRVVPLIPASKFGGRRRTLDMREVVNAIRYLLDQNCSWRNLLDCFPNHASVRHYYDRWRKEGIWPRIEQVLRDSSL